MLYKILQLRATARDRGAGCHGTAGINCRYGTTDSTVARYGARQRCWATGINCRYNRLYSCALLRATRCWAQLYQWTSTVRNSAGQQDGYSYLHQPSFSKAALEHQAAFPVDPNCVRATEFSSRPPHLRKVQYRTHIDYRASGSDCKHCD